MRVASTAHRGSPRTGGRSGPPLPILLAMLVALFAIGSVLSPTVLAPTSPPALGKLTGEGAMLRPGPTPSGSSHPAAGSNSILWTPNSLLSSFEGRQGASVAVDPRNGTILVFGGSNASLGSAPLNTTVLLNLSSGTVHQLPGELPGDHLPPPRAYASLAWDGAANPGRFVLFGGLSTLGTIYDDTWWFYPTNDSWVERCAACGVPARWGASFGAEPGVNLLAVYGGQGSGATLYLSDTWTYAVGSGWTNVTTATTPPALFNACSVALSGTGGLLMFGGALSNGDASAQTWELDWSTFHWSQLSLAASPAGREACALSNALSGTRAILYGGLNGTAYYGDAWEFDPVTPSWTTLGSQTPGSRAYSDLVNFTYRGVDSLWLYGGANSTDAGLASADAGALLPASLPVLGTPDWTPPTPLLDVPLNITVRASASGLLTIQQVSVNVSYPGGGVVRGALLSRFNGTGSDGNWTAVLPGPSSSGPLSWTLTAIDDSGATVSASGSFTVEPGLGTVQGFVYGDAEIGGAPHTVPLNGAEVFVNGTGNTTNLLTGGSGSFSFSLPAGAYTLTACDPGYRAQSLTATVAWSTTQTLDLILPNATAPTGMVQGFVYTNSVVGGVPRTLPLEGATVFANGTGNTTQATSGVTGAFSFQLPPGRYDVTALFPGKVSENETATVQVGAATSLDLVLPNVSMPTGHLQGFVYALAVVAGHPSQTPLSGATVTVTGVGPGNVTEAVTGSGGAYSVSLAVGVYEVGASAHGYPTQSNTTSIAPGATSSLDFWLPSPSTKGGVDFLGNATVLGTSNPETLVGVEVWVNASNGVSYPVELTNANGSYAFNLQPGAYYYVNYTIPGFVAPSYYFDYPVGGYVVHHDANLTATNPAVELFVALSPSSNSPVTGSSVTVSILVQNGNKQPPSSGLVDLFLVGPANSSYVAITGGSGAPLSAAGTQNITFTAPPGITQPSTFSLHAVVTASGFAAKVSEEIAITVEPPPQAPASTSWFTYAVVGALAFAVAVLALYVVARRNPPRVEEIFLIYKGGKLVWHASRTARADLEPEVVTGMLEAVEGFVQRSFTPEGGRLNVLEFANMKLHIVRGERLTAAALIGGRNPAETVREVEVALADMEVSWKEALRDWDGSTTSLPNLRAYVEALLSGYYMRHSHLKTPEPEVPPPAPPAA